MFLVLTLRDYLETVLQSAIDDCRDEDHRVEETWTQSKPIE